MPASNSLELTLGRLDVGAICELVADEGCGAVSLFVGTTRDNFEGKQVVSLEYEAYESMARRVMAQIVDRMRERWPAVRNVAIHHRLGVVPVKEASVVVAVSSPHRGESLAAVQFGIEQLKRLVPIWKKEVYAEEDSSEWKENKECTWSVYGRQEEGRGERVEGGV